MPLNLEKQTMAKIDWSYHRPGCTTCKRTQDYLAKGGIEAKAETNAKKETLGREDALKLLASATQLRVAKGQKVVEVNLKKDRPADEELLKLVLGPTGNLRAPTLQVGKTLVVGFNEEMYNAVL